MPKSSNPINSEVIGQFVTPQKTEIIPTAEQRDGENPKIWPNKQPNVAPTKNEGTISPPLKPEPMVIAVKIILRKKSYH